MLRWQALRVASEATHDEGIDRHRVDAIPQPFSPLNWKLVVTQGTGYRVAHVNLAGHPALVPPLPGLAGWRAVAQAYVPPDRLASGGRALLGAAARGRA